MVGAAPFRAKWSRPIHPFQFLVKVDWFVPEKDSRPNVGLFLAQVLECPAQSMMALAVTFRPAFMEAFVHLLA